MIITKCDKCGSEIEFRKSVLAGIDMFYKLELCQTCGEPILKFLKTQKFPKAQSLFKMLEDKQFTDKKARI